MAMMDTKTMRSADMTDMEMEVQAMFSRVFSKSEMEMEAQAIFSKMFSRISSKALDRRSTSARITTLDKRKMSTRITSLNGCNMSIRISSMVSIDSMDSLDRCSMGSMDKLDRCSMGSMDRLDSLDRYSNSATTFVTRCNGISRLIRVFTTSSDSCNS